MSYSIPHNDSGDWHYKIHPGRLTAQQLRPRAAPVGGYPTRAAAIDAAERAIDDWLYGPSR